MDNRNRRVVAVALDDVMVYAFFVLVHSLVSNSNSPFELLVGHFTSKLSDKNQKLIGQFLRELGIRFRILELTPHPLFTERRHLTITTFSKFVISDEVQQPHLWIDLDTVARKGWDEIFPAIFKASDSTVLVVAGKLESPHTRFDGFNAGVLGWTKAPRADWMPTLAALPAKRFSSEQFLFNTLYREFHEVVDVKFNFLSSWHTHNAELQRAAIIHYSGPVKPWHLLRRHAVAWDKINSSWSSWFEAETALHHHFTSSNLSAPLKGLARQALLSGRMHMGKGALAGWVMRALTVLGVLGDPLVALLSKKARR
jgi:lipopolysaccharide biosynthesis glycosyltransferase